MKATADPQTASPKDIARIWKVMEKQRIAFLVTEGDHGPHARPMHAIVRPTDGQVWFLTDSASIKDGEIEADSRVALVFTDGGSTHLAVTGLANVVRDRATVEDLWSTAAQAFYPDGPDDPSIIAIRVLPRIAELWDGPSAPVALVQLAAALVSGRSAADIGHNVRANLE